MTWRAMPIVAACMMVATATCSARELNCKVTVDRSQVQGTTTAVFERMQEDVSEYLNTRRWTDAHFAPNERIDCTLFITVKSYDDPVVVADVQIQSSRPVYNSTYSTTLINFKESAAEWEYREGDPLTFTEHAYNDNLTAILNFYAYIIIGLDFDTFSPRGGDDCFSRAADVAHTALSAGAQGWRQFDSDRNRASLLTALTDPASASLRDLYYKYHRNGLDEMSVSPDKGRLSITTSLDIINRVNEASPMGIATTLWKDAKLDELVNIYSRAPKAQREKVYNMLRDIYPTEEIRLQMIKNGSDD